jgi:hypothetical protein
MWWAAPISVTKDLKFESDRIIITRVTPVAFTPLRFVKATVALGVEAVEKPQVGSILVVLRKQTGSRVTATVILTH